MKTIQLAFVAALLTCASVYPTQGADVSQDFTGWAFSFIATTRTDAGWTAYQCRVLSRDFTPSGDMAVWLNNTIPTYVETPHLTNGYGTLTFDTASHNGDAISFSIQASTNGLDPWSTIATLTNTAAAKAWTSWTLHLNGYETAHLRITKEATASASLGVDHIHITEPPTKVDFGVPYTSPGAPQVNQSADVFCSITPSHFASNVVASVVYSTGLESGTNSMSLTATENLYTTDTPIPAQALAGVIVNYDVVVTFDGTNALSPASVSSFYEVLEKPFETSYDSMRIIGDETAGMTLVSNYLWRGIVSVAAGTTDANFQFSGDHTNGVTTNVWGDSNPTSSTLVVNGTAEIAPASFITVDSMPTDDYVFMFNENNGDYIVNSADFNDFDTWTDAEAVGDYVRAGWNVSGGWISADPLRKRGTRSLYLTNSVDAYVQTPELTNGVGQISFWLRHWATNTPPETECVVQVSETGGAESNAWTTIGTISVNSTKFNRFVIPRNERYSRYVRIKNQTATEGAMLAIDEFLVAGAGAGVVLTELAHSPASPLTTESVSLSVRLERIRGASNPNVTAHWRTGRSGGYTTITMTEGAGGVWTTTSDIPAGRGDGIDGLGAGTVQYYVSATYEGYEDVYGSPTENPNGGGDAPAAYEIQPARMLYSNVQHSPPAPTINSAFSVEADITPAADAINPYVRLYYRIGNSSWSSMSMTASGSDTHFVSSAPIPTATSPGTPVYYYIGTTFGGPSAVSPTNYPAGGPSDPLFVLSHATTPESDYTNMVIEGSATGTMRLFSDHEWVGIATLGVATNPTFHIRGTSDSSTNLWGDSSNPAGALPLFSTAAPGDDDIGLSGVYSNDFIVYFNESNGLYWAQSCTHQNFDNFLLVPTPSETPTTDAEGWSVKSATVSTDVALEGRGVGLGGGITSAWSYARSPELDGGGAVSFWYRNMDETGTRPGALSIDIREDGGDWVTIDMVTNILSTEYSFHKTELASPSDNLEVQILWSSSSNVTDAPLAIDNFTVENLGPYVTFSNLNHNPTSPLISDPVDVSVDVSAINYATNITLLTWFRIGTNGLFTSTSMTEMTPGNYRTDPAIPRGEPGIMQYYVEATFNSPLSGTTLYAYAPTGGGEVRVSYVNTDTNIGPMITFQEDQGWTYQGTTLTSQENEEWLLYDGFIQGRHPDQGIAPLSFLGPRAAALINTVDQGGTNSHLRSPYLPLGVGVVSFEAFSKNLPSVELELQLSSNGINGWQTIETVTTYSEDKWKQHVVDLQVEQPTFLRFFKPELTGDNQLLALDNIEIVYPSARVAISNVNYTPFYPADSEPVQISCDIESISTFAPALGITARVYHKRSTEPSYTAPPVEMTGNGTHFVTMGGIPAYESGVTVDYYVECTFKGYNKISSFSPTMSPGDAPTSAYNYAVRAHVSSYDTFEISANGETFNMTQVGDESWLGVLNIESPTSNIVIEVEGNGYFDGTNVFNDFPLPWGDSDQASTPPPYFGTMQPSGSNLVLNGEVDGQYVLEFNETTGEYTLRRGVYQDFDTWPAETDYFEYSLNVVDLIQHNEDFGNTNSWPKSVTDVTSDSFDVAWTNVPPEYPPTTGSQSGITDPDLLDESRYRIIDAQIIPQIVGQAAMLDDRATYGAVRTTVDFPNHGTGTFSFDVRCVDDDPAPAMLDLTDYFDTAGVANTTNITVQVKFNASAIPNSSSSSSLGYCHLSFFFHYVDATHYYELRMVQRPNNRRRLELWKCNGGDPWRYKWSGEYTGSITATDSIALLFYRNPSGTSKLRVFRNNGTAAINSFTDGSAITGGTKIGISGMDADINVQNVLVYTTDDLNHFNTGGTLIYNDAAHGRGDWDDGGHPWTITPSSFTRPGFTGDNLAFTVDYIRDEDIDIGNGIDGSVWTTAGTFSGFHNTAYTHVTQTIERPEDLFVRIQHQAGNGHLVIDNVRANHWHGENFVQANGWRASEAWINSEAGTPGGVNILELRTSRAYTNVTQRVRSPLLPNGAATVEFDYKRTSVDPDELILAIEHSVGSTTNTWVSTMVTNAPEDWTPFTWRIPAASSTNAMYVRIRNASTVWGSGAYIDNIRITEPIPIGDETWRGYNVLVTPNLPDKLLPGDDNIKGAYINNHPSNGTDGESYTEAWPFIETPLLTEGVGEVSFFYRAWDSTPSQIEIVAASDRDLPDSLWTPLYTLYTVTNQVYQSFRQHFYERDHKYLRLRIRTDGGYGRACVDNLLVAAPFGASLQVSDVQLIPEIPLHTDEVYVRATVSDHFLNPSNISLRTYYQIGTDGWGSYSDPQVRPMVLISETATNQTYQTTVPIGTTGTLPIDTVVQYYVRAEFDGFFSEISSPLRYKNFTNPDYYWPVDYNKNEASPTPYYVVFSCLPKQVWINELNVADGYAYGATNPYSISPQQYVELCGVAGSDIGGWKINTFMIDNTNVTPNASYTVAGGTHMPNDTNTFGFFVLGKDAVATHDQLLTNSLPTPGGIHLVRSMGAVEHSICYETIPDDLNRAVTNNPEYRFVFVGVDDDYDDGALYADGTGSNGTDFAEGWGLTTAYLYSPGAINNNQTLVPWPDATGTNDYAGALIISGFWMDQSTINFIVEAEETGLQQMTPWYTTNLLGTVTWTEGANSSISASGQTYTVSCDLVPNTTGCFYKVTNP